MTPWDSYIRYSRPRVAGLGSYGIGLVSATLPCLAAVHAECDNSWVHQVPTVCTNRL